MLNLPPLDPKAPCPHFGICGGCSLQNMESGTYTSHKTQMVTKELTLKGLADVIVSEPRLIPAGHRRRCNLKAARIQNEIHLGYHEHKSHNIAQISQCPLIVPELEALILPLRDLLKNLLRHKQKVDLFLLATDTGVDFIVDGISNLSIPQTQAIVEFCQEHRVSRFSLRHKGELDPIVTFQQPTITYGGIPVTCQADGFTQASKMADDILTSLVLAELPSPCKRALDLFCGRGTFSLPLSRHTKVDAFELDIQAIKALEKARNKASLPLQTFTRNLFENPLERKELNPYDFAVINPPRAGAQSQCQVMSHSDIPTIVMVSCEPKTFARDAAILIQGGYNLKHVTPVDQFLWSNHVEVVGCFHK